MITKTVAMRDDLFHNLELNKITDHIDELVHDGVDMRWIFEHIVPKIDDEQLQQKIKQNIDMQCSNAEDGKQGGSVEAGLGQEYFDKIQK